MNHFPSVLLPYSIESFLSDDEISRVLQAIDAYKAANPEQLQAGAHGFSIHQSPDLPVSEVIGMYEPAGRLEINSQHIPRAVADIAEQAFYRQIENIRRAYPATHGPFGFTYVEYAVGQYFTPHIDGVGEDQKVGFGVTLTDDFEGGEFVIQTCGSNRLWVADGVGQARTAPCQDMFPTWVKSIPKTEWVTRPKRGDAIFYGGALTHASRPVTYGVLKKLLGFTH